MVDLINCVIEIVEAIDKKILVAAGVLLLLGIITQPTFINLFVDLFKDALGIAIAYKFLEFIVK